MPKQLKKFDFPETRGAGGTSTYDWATLLDGNIYKCIEGEDYTCKTENFAMMARDRAKAKGLSLKLAKLEDGTGVVIQAVPATKEQLARWETQKAAAAARKAAAANGNGDSGDETE